MRKWKRLDHSSEVSRIYRSLYSDLPRSLLSAWHLDKEMPYFSSRSHWKQRHKWTELAHLSKESYVFLSRCHQIPQELHRSWQIRRHQPATQRKSIDYRDFITQNVHPASKQAARATLHGLAPPALCRWCRKCKSPDFFRWALNFIKCGIVMVA